MHIVKCQFSPSIPDVDLPMVLNNIAVQAEEGAITH